MTDTRWSEPEQKRICDLTAEDHVLRYTSDGAVTWTRRDRSALWRAVRLTGYIVIARHALPPEKRTKKAKKLRPGDVLADGREVRELCRRCWIGGDRVELYTRGPSDPCRKWTHWLDADQLVELAP